MAWIMYLAVHIVHKILKYPEILYRQKDRTTYGIIINDISINSGSSNYLYNRVLYIS